MTDTTCPSMRQRELGTQLRELRNQRGLTVEDVAEDLLCSPTKVSRIETGARCPSLRDVRDLCELYGVNRPARARLIDLAGDAWERGWWTEYDDLKLDPFSRAGDAVVSGSFVMSYVPALLQTEEYARTIIEGTEPNMDADVYRQWVEAGIGNGQVSTPGIRPYYRIARE